MIPSESIPIDKHIVIGVASLALLTASCTQTLPRDLGTPTPTHPPTEMTAALAIASQTPVSATATVTPEPIVDVPSWLSEPDADVVMTKTVKYNEQLSKPEYGVVLFNASTGERFDLPLEDIVAYFWMPDGRQIGLLLGSDESGLYLVDGATGKITRSELTESITKHAVYGGELTALVPSGDDVTAPDFFLFNPPGRYYFRYGISADEH